jgi:hypothetical protein
MRDQGSEIRGQSFRLVRKHQLQYRRDEATGIDIEQSPLGCGDEPLISDT